MAEKGIKESTKRTVLKLDAGYCSHSGLGRRTNEDALFPLPVDMPAAAGPRGRLWAVADGMGGHSGGKVASALACRLLQTYYDRPLAENAHVSIKGLCRHLAETVLRIDRQVRRRAQSNEALTHMGTTLSCLLLADGYSIIAHVGDSRIYRWRRGYFSRLTTDHTFVQDMIFEGEVAPGNARLHPLRHLLTNAVGTGEPLCHVEHRTDRIHTGDRFLLCTDGLYNVLSTDRLAALISSDGPADHIAEALVAEALKKKTQDNVTALVVSLVGHESEL